MRPRRRLGDAVESEAEELRAEAGTRLVGEAVNSLRARGG
jgi:hypothetical protein